MRGTKTVNEKNTK